MSARFVAVVDIGKTNAKLALHDLREGADVFVATTPNEVRRDGPYPHHDTERLFAFLLDALGRCAGAHAIDAVSVTTHGASAVLVGENDLVLPHLDYEHDGPEACRDAYDRARPPFAETLSPRLPNGLNVGAQLFWLERTFPEKFRQARHVLFVPQYWVWRLTGVAASEVTSLGCHTDLWRPGTGSFSTLVEAEGWERLFPPMRSAFDAVGPLRPQIAERVGLAHPSVPVFCGIHDSNASLLPHLLSMPAPFAVLSTGTWIIAFAVGGSLSALDPARDTLANVDALGRPVPSARFMGGREFDLLTQHEPGDPTPEEIDAVLASDLMALPPFAPDTGPFPQGAGGWVGVPRNAGERSAAASLYCAMMTAESLQLIGAGGPTVVEGPFARNRLFLDALRVLTNRPVVASAGATGTTAGAALLAAGREAVARPADDASPIPANAEAIHAYAARWWQRARGGAKR